MNGRFPCQHKCAALLSRPFDDSKVTATSGSRVWVDVPQSALINGHGYFGDCNLLKGGSSIPPTCNITLASVPPGRSALNPQATQANQGASLTAFLAPLNEGRVFFSTAAAVARVTDHVERADS